MSSSFRQFATSSLFAFALASLPSPSFATAATSGLDTPVPAQGQPEIEMPFSISDSQMMELTSTGLGIGPTTVPTRLLDVATTASGGVLPIFRTNSTANTWMTIQNGTANLNLGVGASTPAPYIYSGSGNFFIGADGTPTVYVNGMNNGKVGIDTSIPGATLDVNGTLNVSGTVTFGPYFSIAAAPNSSSTNTFSSTASGGYNFTNPSGFTSMTVGGPITTVGATLLNNVTISQYFGYGGNLTLTTGSVTAYGYYFASDARLKEDIRPIEHALDKLLAIRGVTFNWKKDGRHDMGVVAQNVAEVFPDIVTKDDKGIMSVEYGNLIGPMIESIRELKADNDDLRHQLSDLQEVKAQMSQIKLELQQLQTARPAVENIDLDRMDVKQNVQIVH